jgi:hypothetical protein
VKRTFTFKLSIMLGTRNLNGLPQGRPFLSMYCYAKKPRSFANQGF